jgi:cytochrome c oxidase subunit 3
MEPQITVNTVHYRDDTASKMGMWLFLMSELLLFGGMFLVYMVYRLKFSHDFILASKELDIIIGTANTIVLLTSSMTIAMSISAMQKGNTDLAIALIWFTVAFALVFLINKYFEWAAKFQHGLFPGMEHYSQIPYGERLYFSLYFLMTGLHALHVIVGATLLLVVIHYIRKGKIHQKKYALHENAGLYWHLVDVIWIYLYPLFYLIK